MDPEKLMNSVEISWALFDQFVNEFLELLLCKINILNMFNDELFLTKFNVKLQSYIFSNNSL